MTNQKYQEILNNMTFHRTAVRQKKSKDYATGDVLSNFKRIASAAKALGIDVTRPYGYAMFMAIMKLDRINNLVSYDKKPENESVQDSIEDLLNYVELMYACIVEESK